MALRENLTKINGFGAQFALKQDKKSACIVGGAKTQSADVLICASIIEVVQSISLASSSLCLKAATFLSFYSICLAKA